MKKIAYIELDTHAEILSNFRDLMQNSAVFSVDYFISEKIQKLLSFQENVRVCNFKNILQKLSENQYDLVILGTAHRYFSTFLKINQLFNTSLIIHNVNFSKCNRFTLFQNIFKEDVLFRLKLFLKEGLLQSPKLHKTVKFQLFLDNELQKNAEKKNSYFLPIFSTKLLPETEMQDATTIVIPGTVSQQRRDYQHVFSVLKNAKPEDKYEFAFLGKASGNELEQLKGLRLSQNINIHYFEEKIPSSEFQKWMEKANVLWCPIQKETSFFSVKEIYGSTKMTGNLGDAIQFGKAAVFPRDYPYHYPFVLPEEKDIFLQFQSLKSFNYDFQANFGKAKILSDLEKTLLELI